MEQDKPLKPGIGLNLNILPLTMCLAGNVVASWFLRQEVAGWQV